MTEPRPEPQPLLAPLTSSAIFLVATIEPGGERTVRDLLSEVPGLARAVGFRAPESRLSCVVGVGSDAWDRLFAGPRPAELHPLEERVGRVHRAPSTPGDLLFHIRGQRMDMCFELAGRLAGRLANAAAVVDEVHGFKYFDNRDLLGFVDGTENPVGSPAYRAVVIDETLDPGADAAFAGGSYVVVQKYLHDLTAWNALPTEAQERAVGRTKLADVELDDDVKPADSHVALNTVEDEAGNELQILRMNMPFGSVERGEYGTYFIGYCKTPSVIERMLDNMFLGDPPGTHDRLLDFSTAVTGSLYFVPSQDFLDDPPPAPGAADTTEPVPETASEPASEARAEPDAADAHAGSLRIGSLKRSTTR
ncbi:Dyp-type peroxidase [Yinghuangia seranimata]|uniref:Dyp-type peroxidase n=1 Tax=Yinghuangia seranimata TaxID=408067 RepID=UPI00248AA7E4|nr:Dyp-type peroxidase [Yinghuangia seranimata]MDI2125977.1 Dyp-type peroxidase [Yinghuangia seranimata]